jgi:hypothetical protein
MLYMKWQILPLHKQIKESPNPCKKLTGRLEGQNNTLIIEGMPSMF